MTREELIAVYEKLSAPFPREAIERTKASETKKGYDTTGVKYQYCVNRLNEVLGVGCFTATRDFVVEEGAFKSGGKKYDVTCDIVLTLGLWDTGMFVPFAEAVGTGGHTSSNLADAKKGAFTNAFKKTVAFFGVGRQAYEGTLDDDNIPIAEHGKPANEPEYTIETLSLFTALKSATTMEELSEAAAKIGTANLTEDQLVAARSAYKSKKEELLTQTHKEGDQ